ncbi:hypothetical protein [Actinomadura gamaensis]|uniref:Uncharacterized protein n=1 Tax=Actinomadura gamaensis TaxID=1763541 RepID=A0ABV9TW03_9ACTN
MTEQQPGDVLDEAAKLLDAVRRRVGDAARAATSGRLPGSDDNVWAKATAPEEGRPSTPEPNQDDANARAHAGTDARGDAGADARARAREDVWARATEEARAETSRGRAGRQGKAAREDVWARVLAEGPHIATGAPECRDCPVCRAIALARESGPDVRRHLEQAGRSLLAAAFDVVAAYERSRAGRAGSGPSGASDSSGTSGSRERSGRDAMDVG